MTDAGNGSDTSGNPESGSEGADNGSNGAPVAFLDGLSEDNRKVAEAKGWDAPDKAVASYRELESKFGESLRLPGDDASADDWAKFYQKTGRPEAPTGYEFAPPDGMDENFPYDKAAADQFANWAHDAGLSSRQAQAIHDKFILDRQEAVKADFEKTEARADEAEKSLIEEWGPAEGENFKRHMELAKRSVRELGGEELHNDLKTHGLLADDGSVLSVPLAKMLSKVGNDLYGEDHIYGSEVVGANPFSKENENRTQQAQLYARDPEQAKRLIIAAGRQEEFPTAMGKFG